VQDIATTVKAPAGGAPILTPSGDAQIIPMRGVRRTIANRLRQSVDMAVHFSVMDEADVSGLDEVRKKLSKASGEKVSYLPFIVSAVCRAVKQFPALNAHVDDEGERIVRYPAVHMGIAADTEQGLSVPVIPDADAMGVLQIGREISGIAAAVRDRSIPRERLMGSTITISNVGSYAGRFATPIINYPEVAILAAGRVHEGVVADKGSIRIAKLLPLSLTCDHRCVDGADAARCLNLIIELLRDDAEGLTMPARG
jgi:pyruvate dehydrogenase E2 component (dihydrolipoamide acetyltransferase)